MALVPFPGPQSGALQFPPDDEEDVVEGEGSMSFLEHLDELRKRILYACYAIGIGILSTFWFHQQLFDFVLEPTRRVLPEGTHLVYTQPGEAFSLHIQIALLAGIITAAPIIMYQVWRFIAPGLYANEKRMAIPFVVLTTLGLVAGAAFNHYVAFPFMIAFFGTFNSADLQFLPALNPIWSMYMRFLIAMGITFQLPTLVYFLARMKLITAKFLVKNFKYAVLIIFIVAAVITPGADPGTQAVFAAPMIGLYIISIAIAWLVGPKRFRGDGHERP
jgi:sec-independent protein translocase protein TatC